MLNEISNDGATVTICSALAAEMDEMRSFYHDKSHQIWLWRAAEHSTNIHAAFILSPIAKQPKV